MSITPEEWKALTESKYWRPEVGRQYNVIMQGWRYERRAFKEDPTRMPLDEERRPTFVADVMSIDGNRVYPAKEFSSSNKALNRLLMAAVQFAERNGRNWVKLNIGRIDSKTYTVVDLTVVADAMRQPTPEWEPMNEARLG